jgi:phosphotransferase system HPr (HPr) family protein
MQIIREVTVNWVLGLHIRPATHIAKLLRKFSCQVRLVKDNESCDAKSVIQIITLFAPLGDRIKIVADGWDAVEATDALVRFFREYSDEEAIPKTTY